MPAVYKGYFEDMSFKGCDFCSRAVPDFYCVGNKCYACLRMLNHIDTWKRPVNRGSRRSRLYSGLIIVEHINMTISIYLRNFAPSIRSDIVCKVRDVMGDIKWRDEV